MDLAKYVGRDYATYNCFDLVKEFYVDAYGLRLKNYYEGPMPDRKGISSLVISHKGDFEQIQKPEFGDLIIIRMFGYASHLGIYVGEGRFLHSVKNRGSCVEYMGKYAKMIEGFYRHRERSA